MKRPKILYILNVANKINNFSLSSIISAKEMGIDFHIAGNWSYANDIEKKLDEERYGIRIHQIDFVRAPYNFQNRKAYKKLKELIRTEKYDYIHCNTPVGGLLGRIVAEKCKVKKVIYQVHGFHFYKGAPKVNWFVYYPIEKWLARKTDAIITINTEDYEFAKRKMKLKKGGKVYYVPGVGIQSELFTPNEQIRESKRAELGLTDENIMIISSGNLDSNKNFDTAIRALAHTNDANIHLYICGQGVEMKKLDALVRELNIKNNVHLLGFRSDMRELLCAADIFIMPTFREGLSRSIMEGMASGLPCVVSKIRGNVDLVENGKGGFLCDPTDAKGFAEAIRILANDPDLRANMRKENLERIKRFDLSVAIKSLKTIYAEVFEDKK